MIVMHLANENDFFPCLVNVGQNGFLCNNSKIGYNILYRCDEIFSLGFDAFKQIWVRNAEESQVIVEKVPWYIINTYYTFLAILMQTMVLTMGEEKDAMVFALKLS